jgi:hypothetical protein
MRYVIGLEGRGGYVRGTLDQLQETNDPATAMYAHLLLLQVDRGGVDYVRDLLQQVTGRV